MKSKSSTVKVGIIAYENCTSSMILGMMDILSLANAQWPHFSLSLPACASPLFDIEIVTLSGKPVVSFNQYPISPKNHGDEEIVKIHDWLETNFKKPVSIDTLTKIFSLSRRTLSRQFKAATGDTPLEYLQRLRVENEKRLLESSSHTFSEITWDVGYHDISSFQRLFSKSTGLSPGAYRKKFSMIEA